MKYLLLCVLIAVSVSCFSQNSILAEQYVNDGVTFHDKGEYDSAISYYRKALVAYADYPRALYETCYTYYASGKNDSAIIIANKILDMNVSDEVLKNTFVTLGSVYDLNKQPEKSVETYRRGIKKFPDFYLLYYNLAITQYSNNIYTDNIFENFQKALLLNPLHTGSNYGIYTITKSENKIPAVLSAVMVCIAEHKTKRSIECASFIVQALTPDVKSDSVKKNITIYVPSSSLSEAKENNFSTAELGLSLMAAAPDVMDTLQLETPTKKLSFQFQSLCNFLGEAKKAKGFYWKFYAPFFYALKNDGYVEVLVHLILMNSNKDSAEWLSLNKTEVDKFYSWAKSYQWPKK